jgi:hypothetical protein
MVGLADVVSIRNRLTEFSNANESAEPLSQDHTAGKTGKQSPSAQVTESLGLEPPKIRGGRGQGKEYDGETDETED